MGQGRFRLSWNKFQNHIVMFCKYCGAPVPDGSKFCPSCGASLGAPAAPKADVKPEPKPEPKPEARPQPKPEPKPKYTQPETEEEEGPQKPYMSMKELFAGAKFTARPEINFMSKKHLILLVVILVIIIIAALLK